MNQNKAGTFKTQPNGSPLDEDIDEEMAKYFPNHVLANSYNLTGISASDFGNRYGGAGAGARVGAAFAFDLNTIQKDFKTHCHDYQEQIVLKSKSYALEFANKVLCIIEPESRSIIKTGLTKTWQFVFKYKSEDHNVFVLSAYELNYKYINSAREMKMSTKQACLIAMDTYSRFNEIFKRVDQMFLTPMVETIFSRKDIPKLVAIYELEQSKVIAILNESCQPGGECLPNSDFATCIVAFFILTRNHEDQYTKKIVDKIAKQYLRAKKPLDKAKMLQLAYYAIGKHSEQLTLDEFKNLMKQVITVVNEGIRDI